MSHKVRRVAPECITRSLVKTVFQSAFRLANSTFLLELNSFAPHNDTMVLCRSAVRDGDGSPV